MIIPSILSECPGVVKVPRANDYIANRGIRRSHWAWSPHQGSDYQPVPAATASAAVEGASGIHGRGARGLTFEVRSNPHVVPRWIVSDSAAKKA
jgi:hypothetical protein